MMRFTQPQPPTAFAKRVNAIRAGTANDDDIWGKYKKGLIDAQHSRCGYCDASLRGTGEKFHDVDHYRPKGRLDEIHDANAEQKCCEHIAPEVRTLSATGYDWLRLEWTNYVYACKECNEIFKRCLFPVEDGSRTFPLDATNVGKEKPLLLWCYGAEDPTVHLEFSRNGAIAAHKNSAHGFATIHTCGLSRRGLRGDRREKCEDAFEISEMILACWHAGNHEALLEWLKKCAKRGNIDAPFAGVFRIIVEQELSTSWNEIVDLMTQLLGPPDSVSY